MALGDLFERVVATEPSAAQLAEAVAHPRVRYHQAAENAPMPADASVDLLTVAQAAHWFDRPAYYAEVRRVARPGAVVALWTYALCAITPEVDAAVYRFYADARYRKEEGRDPIPELRAGLLALWGERALRRRVTWSLAGRIGRVE